MGHDDAFSGGEKSRHQPGQTLAGRFHLVRHLEEGGLANVWQAEDLHLDGEPVACKVLKEDYARDQRAISDLKREVLLARRLRHPNILAVYTFWETPADRFVTMEYVEGEDLGHALRRRGCPFSLQELLPWLGKLASALDYAHESGILHRDVKPGNILLDHEGVVRLGDFGIARTLQETQSRHTGGETCGTVMYMSPEQLKGHPVGPRSDQYSLAASIYELLSGAPPFRSEDVVSDIQLRPPSLLNRVGSAVNEAIQRALVKEPENRYTSCGALVEALQRAGGAAPVVPPGESMLENHRADQTVVLPRPDTAMLRMRLGAILRAEGLITEMQLQEALTIQQEKKEKLGAILVWLGFVDEESIAQALSQQLKVPFSLLDGEELDTSLLETWPLDLALSHVCLPLRYLGNLIVVAMADPLDLQTLNEVEARFGRQAQLLVTTATCLRERVEALSEKLA